MLNYQIPDKAYEHTGAARGTSESDQKMPIHQFKSWILFQTPAISPFFGPVFWGSRAFF